MAEIFRKEKIDEFMTRLEQTHEWRGDIFAESEGLFKEMDMSDAEQRRVREFLHFFDADKSDNLDAYVEYWHTHDTGDSLAEFLGMSDEEYAEWVRCGDSVLINRRFDIFANKVHALGGVWATKDVRISAHSEPQCGTAYMAQWPDNGEPKKTIYLEDGVDIAHRFDEERIECEQNIQETIDGIFADMGIDGRWLKHGEEYVEKNLNPQPGYEWDQTVHRCGSIWRNPITGSMSVVPVGSGAITPVTRCRKVIFRAKETRTVHIEGSSIEDAVFTHGCIVTGEVLNIDRKNHVYSIKLTLKEDGREIETKKLDIPASNNSSVPVTFRFTNKDGFRRTAVVYVRTCADSIWGLEL